MTQSWEWNLYKCTIIAWPLILTASFIALLVSENDGSLGNIQIVRINYINWMTNRDCRHCKDKWSVFFFVSYLFLNYFARRRPILIIVKQRIISVFDRMQLRSRRIGPHITTYKLKAFLTCLYNEFVDTPIEEMTSFLGNTNILSPVHFSVSSNVCNLTPAAFPYMLQTWLTHMEEGEKILLIKKSLNSWYWLWINIC